MERLIVCLGLLLLGISTCLAQTCPGSLGWHKYQDKCYKFNSYPRLSKNDAIKNCQNDGATLLSINIIPENQFIDQWLQANDEARQQWLTSGIVRSDGVRWEGDGTTTTSFHEWLNPEMNPIPGSQVILEYSGTEYKWNVGLATTNYPFICEISISEVYRIAQEFRDFDYGLNVDSPSLAPRGPKFIKEPENTVILGVTDAFHMDCVASALPEPSYMWLRKDISGNMVEIDPGQNPRLTFTTGRLTVTKPESSDAGVYQCMAINEYGEILSQSVTVSFGDLGEFNNVKPASVSGIQYQGAQLECPYITGTPAISYQWYKGTFNFIRPDFQTHTFISANGRLYFSALAPTDQDTYKCMATLTSLGDPGNYLGAYQAPSSISLGTDLKVTSGGAFDQAPIIQNEFPFIYPTNPKRGSDVTIECFAYGNGELEYSWDREGKPLPKNHRFRSNDRILTLPDAGLEDDGNYTCTVNSPLAGQAVSKSVQLYIQAKPYFTYELTNQHVDIDSQLTWTCEANGRPTPVYSWYKNGKVLQSSAGVTVTKNHLVIDKLDPERDDGMYQCGADNRYGTTYSSAQLRVLKLKPSFEKTPMVEAISSSLGGNVTILCNPIAAPKPTYTWFKDNSRLELQMGVFQDDDHYKLLLNGNLMITNIQSSDQGTYKCMVENKFGKAEDQSVLSTMDSTMITIAPSDDKVEVNLSIVLMCEASHPANVDMIYLWKFEDHIINYDREPEFKQGSDTTSGAPSQRDGYLYLRNAQYKNQGYYTCIASTGKDSVHARAYITVLGPPGEPMGVTVRSTPFNPPDDLNDPAYQSNLNTTRWLRWTDGDTHHSPITHYNVEFNTGYDKTWRIHPDGRSLTRAEVTNENFPYLRFAKLTNLKAGTMVQFRVVARNAYGLGTPSAPSPETKIQDSKPVVKVEGVRGGGGSVGDLAVVWDPLPEEDHNGRDLKYKVGWREYTGASNSQIKWNFHLISAEKACMFVPDFRTGLIHICKYVELVGAYNYYKPYEVVVAATNIVGEGPLTEPVVIMSAEELPLTAPTKVHALQYNSTALNVQWVPIPNDRKNARGTLKGYKINYWKMRGELETDALQNIIEIPKGATNLQEGLIIGLEAFEWYTFNVQAYNSAGNGPKSSDYDQQTYNREPEQYPTEVHVYSVEGFGVRVNFRGISTQWREEPLLGYIVQYWKARENIMSARETNFGKRSTGVIRNLTSSELYQLRVYGYSRGGQGQRSSPSIYFTVGDGEIVINQETMEIQSTASLPAALNTGLLCLVVVLAGWLPRYWS